MDVFTQFRQKWSTLWFLVILLLIYGFLGIYSVLPLRPQSVHQWAQTDRASVALRYYEDGMQFFFPRVQNIANGTGITGMEFPLTNYTAAVLYKVFGYHELLFRLLMLCIITIGVLAAFTLAQKVLLHPLWAGLLTLTWYLSPLLVYYSPNFLSDTASLGLIMIAWLAFFKLKEKYSVWWLLILFLSTALAALTKVVSAISIVAMLVVLLMDHLHFFTSHATNIIFKKKGLIASALGGSLILTASWYLYASYLNDHYQSVFFLLTARTALSISEMISLADATFNLWGRVYYYKAVLILILLILPFSIILIKKMNRLLFVISCLLLLGSLIYYILMNVQFRDHDYYIITLLPMVFFLFLLMADAAKRLNIKWQRFSLVGIAFLFLISAVYAKKRHNERYALPTPAHHAYFDLDSYLDSLGVSRESKIYSLFDPSPNITLYLMNRRGYAFTSEYLPEEFILFQLYLDIDYAVVNDTSSIDYNSVRAVLDRPIGHHKGLIVYELNISDSSRTRFFDFAYKLFEPYIGRIKSDPEWLGKVQRTAQLQELPLDRVLVRGGIGLYLDDVTYRIIPKAQVHLPGLITKNNTISYSALNELERQKFEILVAEGTFDEFEAELIRKDYKTLMAEYGVEE